MKSILKDIQGVESSIKRDNVKYDKDRQRFHELQIRHLSVESHDSIIKILDKWEHKLTRIGVMLSYTFSKIPDLKFMGGDSLDFETTGTWTYSYNLFFKDIHNTRIKTDRYVYHFSNKSNRQEILKDGIKARNHKQSTNWKGSNDLAYPPAVFAINHPSDNWRDDMDKWRIDTSMIPNKWWMDLNFHKREDVVMTFDSIPLSAIELVNRTI
jgi:hypothetical protein